MRSQEGFEKVWGEIKINNVTVLNLTAWNVEYCWYLVL